MNTFGEEVLNEIRARSVVPIPAWHFLLRRSVFWSLAIASVFFGGIAFAVADFVFFDNEGVGAAMLLESPLESFLQSIPFIWLVVFVLFVLSAFFGLRHTKKGYRFKTFQVVSTVVFVTICLGIGLNALDFGQAVHDYLLTNTNFYDSLIHSRDDLK